MKVLVSAVTSWLSSPMRSVWLPGTDASDERPDQSVVTRTAPLSGCGVLCRSSFTQLPNDWHTAANISSLQMPDKFIFRLPPIIL